MLNQTCPCGSKEYSSCCQALHLGHAHAVTAEQLMRSRFSAFAMGLGHYLFDTHHPDFRAGLSVEMLGDNGGIQWQSLIIIAANRDTALSTNKACVEFKATYLEDESLHVMHERSSFLRYQGQWVYTQGEQQPTSIGRNQSCPCQSGKKYKQCCGR